MSAYEGALNQAGVYRTDLRSQQLPRLQNASIEAANTILGYDARLYGQAAPSSSSTSALQEASYGQTSWPLPAQTQNSVLPNKTEYIAVPPQHGHESTGGWTYPTFQGQPLNGEVI